MLQPATCCAFIVCQGDQADMLVCYRIDHRVVMFKINILTQESRLNSSFSVPLRSLFAASCTGGMGDRKMCGWYRRGISVKWFLGLGFVFIRLCIFNSSFLKWLIFVLWEYNIIILFPPTVSSIQTFPWTPLRSLKFVTSFLINCGYTHIWLCIFIYMYVYVVLMDHSALTLRKWSCRHYFSTFLFRPRDYDKCEWRAQK